MNPTELIRKALCDNDAALLRQTLAQHPALKAKINEPLGLFDSPLINSVQSRDMLDVFLEAGADINAKSKWWAGGFGLLDSASDDLAAYAIERGAIVEAHSAARLGLMADLRRIISENPELVHARGGDGKTPLHFAKNAEIARFLVEHGADINAKDVDHESTPAQHLIGEHQDVVRYLVDCGCHVDIFIPAALGDTGLARKLLEADPDCLRLRVNSGYFPMTNPKAGGTIYQWTLGFNVSPHEVAKKFGREQTLEFLVQNSPVEVQLLVHCWLGNAGLVRSILAKDGAIGKKLSASEARQLADAARNDNLAAVRLMLEAGLPLDVLGQHGATPLHWASWHGNVEMVKDLLSRGAPLELSDKDFAGTPLDWAIHGSENGWHSERGNYPAVVECLLSAGATIPDRRDGTAEVRKVLESFSRAKR